MPVRTCKRQPASAIKGRNNGLPPTERKKAKKRRVAAAGPRPAEAEQAPAATEEKTDKEPGDAFFAPGKRLPSGSEPVVRFDFNKADIKEQTIPFSMRSPRS